MRMPSKSARLTAGAMERWLKKLGVSAGDYKLWSGNQALKGFATMNPGWTLRRWVELVLEQPQFDTKAANKALSETKSRKIG